MTIKNFLALIHTYFSISALNLLHCDSLQHLILLDSLDNLMNQASRATSSHQSPKQNHSSFKNLDDFKVLTSLCILSMIFIFHCYAELYSTVVVVSFIGWASLVLSNSKKYMYQKQDGKYLIRTLMNSQIFYNSIQFKNYAHQ